MSGGGGRKGQRPIDPEIARRGREMRDAGRSWHEIAVETGEMVARLRYAISPEYHAAVIRAGSKKRRIAVAAGCLRATPDPVAAPVKHIVSIAHHVPRVIGGPLAGEPRPALTEAAALFARGEIDRAELMRRIAPAPRLAVGLDRSEAATQ